MFDLIVITFLEQILKLHKRTLKDGGRVNQAVLLCCHTNSAANKIFFDLLQRFAPFG